jgi:hypothetical protein
LRTEKVEARKGDTVNDGIVIALDKSRGQMFVAQ